MSHDHSTLPCVRPVRAVDPDFQVDCAAVDPCPTGRGVTAAPPPTVPVTMEYCTKMEVLDGTVPPEPDTLARTSRMSRSAPAAEATYRAGVAELLAIETAPESAKYGRNLATAKYPFRGLGEDQEKCLLT